VVVSLLGVSAPAQARLNIFTCEPEWAALARVLAPEAKIFSATHARQDPHEIEARPALISALRRADLAICTGAGLEAGWLPMLQSRAGNTRITPGAPGLLLAAESLPLLEDAHHHPSRDKGHVHAGGNPHIQLDPRLLARVAARIADRLAALDPADAASYRRRLEGWLAEWNTRIEHWQQAAKPLFGEAVIAEHSGFAYLFRWLELYQAADLEPVPGVPPTVSHLQTLLQRARDDPPMAVVQALYQDPQPGRWLADKLAVPLLTLPTTVTADGSTRSLEGLFDHLIAALLAVHGPRRPPR
jgi:zinc/manganese transport system substrate-binding protein